MNGCSIMNERMGMKNKKQGEKMTYAVSINSSGQATIPKAVREFLGVVPGENRIIFDIVKGKVVLAREPSRAEMLDASLKRIHESVEKEKSENPEFARNYEKYKGMSYREFIEAYEDTEEDKKEMKEKYGIDI